MKKIRVGILFGGKSAEHEVSLQSAKNVIEAIDKEKFEVVPIGIDKSGKWLLPNKADFLLNPESFTETSLSGVSESVALTPQSSGEILHVGDRQGHETVDVVFPILHGPLGEDGTVQGLLKLANIPFVGAGVLGSAVGMDKDVMKRLLRDAGIPIGKFLVFEQGDSLDVENIIKELGLPLFVKPANLGSSVGVSKVKNKEEFDRAITHAFEYDTKILVEEYIDGREIECSVLGNQHPKASLPGEIIPTHEFYSYEAKYLDEKGATLEIPAKLEPALVQKIQDISIRTFKALSCEGLARVDSFLTKDGRVLVNEINTIPGFTKISMYPKLWEASGLSYTDLITELIGLALERFEREQKLKTSL